MDEKVKYWVEISEYDLETARSVLNAKRYLYVGFMCHQAIEKMLKANYVFKTKKIPPYTHNLRLLSQEAGLFAELSKDQKAFLNELEPLNIEARYPADIRIILTGLNKEVLKNILQKTEELHLWLKKKL